MNISQKRKESTTVEFLEIESNSEYNGYKIEIIELRNCISDMDCKHGPISVITE